MTPIPRMGPSPSRLAMFLFAWVFVASAVLVTAANPFRGTPAHALTITVDGQIADWTAAAAAFTDSPSDAGGGSGDLTRFWVTADGTNLYARWDEFLTA